MSFYKLLFVVLVFCPSLWAAKKDFKGLFGSYKQEQYVENEVKQFGLGANIHLSALMPLSPIAKSNNSLTNQGEAFHFSTFFNFELEVFYTVWYKWEPFVRVGFMTFDTRKPTLTDSGFDAKEPKFHNITIEAFPVLLGVRYRFGEEDIVPFVGVAAGVLNMKRKVTYDGANLADNETITPLTGEVTGGFEFFFSSNAGLRLEAAINYIKLEERTVNLNPINLDGTPAVFYQSNPISVRYAGGLFFLF